MSSYRKSHITNIVSWWLPMMIMINQSWWRNYHSVEFDFSSLFLSNHNSQKIIQKDFQWTLCIVSSYDGETINTVIIQYYTVIFRIWRKGLVFKASSVAFNQTRRYNKRILRKGYSVPWDFACIENYKLNA